jgi:tRNA pseudouridine synthase 9
VTPTTIVKNGDVVSHSLHRHEPPVTGDSIGVVHEDDTMIVINKPAGVPVHPAGRYNFNSVIEIMRAERQNGWNPLPCNRLDRLTSGIMFVAKTPKAADELSQKIRGRTVQKEYIARVKGRFPDGEVICEQPILAISPKYGLNMVRANGKEAKTVFERIAFYPSKLIPTNSVDASSTASRPSDGYSIVRCKPLTGRTHQIRVHLQFIGHPISNDPIYANQRVWGQNLGKGGDNNDEDIISRLSKMGKEEVAEAVAYHDELVEAYHKRKAEKLSGELCKVCETPLYTDPGVHELGIYLHAKRYECDEGTWSYETPMPPWALPPSSPMTEIDSTRTLPDLEQSLQSLEVANSV